MPCEAGRTSCLGGLTLSAAEITLPRWAERRLPEQWDKHHKPFSDNNNGNNCGGAAQHTSGARDAGQGQVTWGDEQLLTPRWTPRATRATARELLSAGDAAARNYYCLAWVTVRRHDPRWFYAGSTPWSGQAVTTTRSQEILLSENSLNAIFRSFPPRESRRKKLML